MSIKESNNSFSFNYSLKVKTKGLRIFGLNITDEMRLGVHQKLTNIKMNFMLTLKYITEYTERAHVIYFTSQVHEPFPSKPSWHRPCPLHGTLALTGHSAHDGGFLSNTVQIVHFIADIQCKNETQIAKYRPKQVSTFTSTSTK